MNGGEQVGLYGTAKSASQVLNLFAGTGGRMRGRRGSGSGPILKSTCISLKKILEAQEDDHDSFDPFQIKRRQYLHISLRFNRTRELNGFAYVTPSSTTQNKLIWKNFRPRAIGSWKSASFGFFNRLKIANGFFQNVTDQEKLKITVFGEYSDNISSTYLDAIDSHIMFRIRSSSPRWSGTRSHKKSKCTYLRPAKRININLIPSFKKTRNPRSYKKSELNKYKAEIVLGKPVRQFVKSYLDLLEACSDTVRTKEIVHKQFTDRIKLLCAICPSAVFEVISILIESRAKLSPYSKYLIHSSSIIFRIIVNKFIKKDKISEDIPKSPELRLSFAAAPLAPPL